MSIRNIKDIKVGDRVVITKQAAEGFYGRLNSPLTPGKVYTIEKVHDTGAGGTVSLVGERNTLCSKIGPWESGSFGYALFDHASTPLALEDATLDEIVAELRSRGVKGHLDHEVTITERIDLS